MGSSRFLFICLYVWLEKYFSRGDYVSRECLEQRNGGTALLVTAEDVHGTGATAEKGDKKGQPFVGASS
jgi:hypothetical protein